MAVTVTINGTGYSFPQTSETGWGSAVTSWAQAVSQHLLQKTGGTFTLTAEIDFGSTYGLKTAYYKSQGTNVGSTGVIRLANNESIVWRNAANSADRVLKVNASNTLEFNAVELADVSSAQTLSNKTLSSCTINADSNTVTNIDNADIKAGAAIDRSKLASGTASHVLINDGSGVMSSEAALDETRGGTGLTSFTTGDVMYASASNTLSKLGIGSSGQVLTVSSGVPTWGAAEGGGGINYIQQGGGNHNAEVGTTGWATYADAAAATPADGTGGSANVTWTRTTSSPLRGTGSFLFTKDAANRQGQGASYAFSIDSADKSKVMSITFDYEIASGTYSGGSSTTDSDLEVYIYDVTNATVIQPAGYKITGAVSGQTYKHVGCTFQTTTSTSYRLIFHVATTSASAFTVKIDNVSVGPQTALFASPATNWTSYSPTVNTGTTSSTGGRWRRVGDTMEVETFAVFSAAGAATTLTFSLPSGYTMDISKMNNTSNGIFGFGAWYDAGTAERTGHVVYQSTTTFGIVIDNNGVNALQGSALANTDIIRMHARFPISGWDSTVQMSYEADTRVVAARYTIGSTFTVANTTDTIVQANTSVFDTHAAVTTGASWKFTAPVPGFYRVRAAAEFQAASGWAEAEQARLVLYKNGSTANVILGKYTFAGTPAGSVRVNLSGAPVTIQLSAGDYIDVRAYHDNGSTITVDNGTGQGYIEVEKVTGPAAVAASEAVYARYTSAAGASLSDNTISIMDYATKDVDSHGAVTTGASWKFTAPVAGTYAVSAMFSLSSTAEQPEMQLRLYKNNGEFTKLGYQGAKMYSTTAGIPSINGSTIVRLVAGDYIDIRAYQNNAGNVAITYVNDATYNHVSIHKID